MKSSTTSTPPPPFATGDAEHLLDEVLRLVEDPVVRAEIEDPIGLPARTRREIDGRPGVLRHLDRRGSDPARTRVDEQRLTCVEPAELEHGLVRGAVDLDDGRPLGEAPTVRKWHRETRIEDRMLGVSALRHESEHPIAGCE